MVYTHNDIIIGAFATMGNRSCLFVCYSRTATIAFFVFVGLFVCLDVCLFFTFLGLFTLEVEAY